MSSIKRRSGTPSANAETILLAAAGIPVVTVVVVLWASAHLAARVAGTARPPLNPFEVPFALAAGDLAWTATTTAAAAAVSLVLMTTLAAAGALAWKIRHRAARADKAARRMGRGRDVAALSHEGAAAVARRLGIDGEPGLKVGTSVADGSPIYQDFESVSVDICGPRTGKTTSRAIPAIMAAPGAVITTSNKRDLVDATRDPRSELGRVWVFDPQGLVDEPATWWWNPLTYVTDENKAQSLADVFAAAARKPGARTDAYFDSAALDLLAGLLLAAACNRRPITQVYLWITDPNDDEPARILDRSGYPLPAASVRGMVGAPDKQRAGVYGTAQQITSFLTNRQTATWVTPRPGVDQFDPRDFIITADTLYSLSREGRGNAAPVVTALTVAVCEAAEDHAKTQPGGRLAVPMVAVLDEAANVCRWSELPNLYSHHGSRGINILTFLQSWSQGVEVWGRDGMRKLWSAANVKVYGGGVSEVEFLNEISQLIGDYQHSDASVSYHRGSGRSTSHQHRTDRILDVADLAALDRGRIVVFGSGSKPVLAKTQPWYDGRDATAIRASIAAHDPAARTAEARP